MLASSSETKDDISLSYWMEHDNQGNVQQFIWDTRWTLENPDRNAQWPKLQLGGDRLPNRTTSTYWQRETTFVRLKNLQVGYNLPDRIVVVFGVSDTASLRMTTAAANTSVEDATVLTRGFFEGTTTYESYTVTYLGRQALDISGDPTVNLRAGPAAMATLIWSEKGVPASVCIS